MLTNLLASLLAFSGIFAGILLAYFTKEEQQAGRPYFALMQDILLAMILFFFLFSLGWNIPATSILSITLLAILYSFPWLVNPLLYFFLGFMLLLLSPSSPFFITESVLVFLYGMPTGSLWIYTRKWKWDLSIAYHFSFFIPFIIAAL